VVKWEGFRGVRQFAQRQSGIIGPLQLEGEYALMLDAAKKIWDKIQEFMKRIGDLEDGSEETKKEVDQLKREVRVLSKELDHTDKIQEHQGRTIAGLEQRIKKLESEKHGLAVSAGKAKAKNKRLQQELRKN
jgi:chromosome segregation ATPase